ncbi:peptide chain release factor 2 [Rickettsiella grylli]|uniref:peptide chain release factor 2 n=1 Tax=Rickettsiella grylli TaxID=59196 RepID=UPI001F11DFF7|nr:peptide chain release factor 2 [Rickettsiella grylli]
MFEAAPIIQKINDLESRSTELRRYLDYTAKCEALQELDHQLQDPHIWNHPEKAQQLGKTRAQVYEIVSTFQHLEKSLKEINDLYALAVHENADDLLKTLSEELQQLEMRLEQLEFRRMFPHELDKNSAYLEIQAGSGGTEAQDWAEMLLRMYLRWGEHNHFKVDLIEVSSGEVAGIKSATIKVEGQYAYGWLRTETGVHRLVRLSPFDANKRRHTSFAAVFVSPEVDESINIEINPADLRIDTYRASGAGGQHVNRTDSAVRITHIPSGVVVQSQNDRSQHKNRDQAMKQLRAKLYELERRKRTVEKQNQESLKRDIGWGSQIRSYVLDDARIKDLRTGIETGNTQAVLNGQLNPFLIASLKAGL